MRGPDEEISMWVDPRPHSMKYSDGGRRGHAPDAFADRPWISSAGLGAVMPWWPSYVTRWDGSAPL